MKLLHNRLMVIGEQSRVRLEPGSGVQFPNDATPYWERREGDSLEPNYSMFSLALQQMVFATCLWEDVLPFFVFVYFQLTGKSYKPLTQNIHLRFFTCITVLYLLATWFALAHGLCVDC